MTGTPAELRKGLLAASQQHLRGKATLQLSHSYNHSIRAVIFITVITPMSSFYKSHFLQKTLLKFLSGLVFSLELSGGEEKKKKNITCVVPPPSLAGKKRDVPKNIISAKNSWGWGTVSALVVGEGCTSSTWQFGCKRLKCSVPPALRHGHGFSVLKSRLLEGQALYVAAWTGLSGPGRGVLWALLPKAAQHSCLLLPLPHAPAASSKPTSPGLSSPLISLPIWDATGEGPKQDCEAEPSLWLAKWSPPWHNLQPRAPRIRISLGWHEHIRAGLARVLASRSCPAAMTWSLTSLGNQSLKPDDYSLSWIPCKASACPYWYGLTSSTTRL